MLANSNESPNALIDRWIEAEQNGEQFPVPFDLAWQIAGYSTKANAKRKLSSKKSHLKKGEDYSSDLMKNKKEGRSSELIHLTCDAFKHFCLIAETDRGRDIRQYFIEAEKKWRVVERIAPEVASEVEILKLKAEIAKHENQKAKSEQKILEIRQTVVKTCPEHVQQKILGYNTIEKTVNNTIVVKDNQILRDGSTLNKTELCKRYGFMTPKGKPNYRLLNEKLKTIGLSEDCWENTIALKENKEFKKEYLTELDRLLLDSTRQLCVGEEATFTSY